MLNLNNQRSTYGSPNSQSTKDLVIVPANKNGETTVGSPAERAQEQVHVREIIEQRPRSLRMQFRYVRVVRHFGALFLQLVLWNIILQRYFPERVERGNTKRWQGYARAFRNFAVTMGGVMIKMGQFVSTRNDVLPPEVIGELATLRDEVPGVPTANIRTIIESELGPISERYSQFDDQPVAAASLGQVHRARLKTGERVVIKVLRPGIIELCYTDLAAMFTVAKIANRFKFINRRMDAVALIEEFGRVLLEELSYKHEARNAARFSEMFKDDLGVYVPTVYTEHSTDCVLTLEDVTTIKLDDYAALEAAGISRRAVATRLMDTYLRQVFEEGFFHADPHPGNLFIYPLPPDNDAYKAQEGGDGNPFYLIFIDFGMIGTLTPQIINGLIGTHGGGAHARRQEAGPELQRTGHPAPRREHRAHRGSDPRRLRSSLGADDGANRRRQLREHGEHRQGVQRSAVCDALPSAAGLHLLGAHDGYPQRNRDRLGRRFQPVERDAALYPKTDRAAA